ARHRSRYDDGDALVRIDGGRQHAVADVDAIAGDEFAAADDQGVPGERLGRGEFGNPRSGEQFVPGILAELKETDFAVNAGVGSHRSARAGLSLCALSSVLGVFTRLADAGTAAAPAGAAGTAFASVSPGAALIFDLEALVGHGV